MLSMADGGAGATLGPPAEDSGAGSSSEPRVFPEPRKALDEPPADSLACRPFPPLPRQSLSRNEQQMCSLGSLLEDIRDETFVSLLLGPIGVLNCQTTKSSAMKHKDGLVGTNLFSPPV